MIHYSNGLSLTDLAGLHLDGVVLGRWPRRQPCCAALEECQLGEELSPVSFFLLYSCDCRFVGVEELARMGLKSHAKRWSESSRLWSRVSERVRIT